MRGGRLYERPTSALPTAGSDCLSSLLLPTPASRDFKGESAPVGRVRPSGRVRTAGDNSLPDAVKLLPTPVVTDSAGARNETANRSNPDSKHHTGTTLSDAVRLLPTPQAHDCRGPKRPEAIEAMRLRGHEPSNLNEVAVHKLFPTPEAKNSISGSDPERRTRKQSGGDDLVDSGEAPRDWGPYRDAVRRWERVVGRPAPAPSEISRKSGKPVLRAEFSEWLMGLPAGHVTGVPGISRPEALRALGNGVVPQQAYAAYRILLQQHEEELCG